ncbi:CATION TRANSPORTING ATPASE [Salix koriyanagi]|uniref:Calcium-transporting ATPase n=1 Tax=Salix koriyanagi TaxID=2511006 RepID=A0A9Q0VZA6_9ROSI|nr:CATION TRANSPORTING ATPASE [Salix koriyanagi]
MTMRSRKTSDKIILDQENLIPEPKSNQRRWRIAYTAIYFTRLLVSLSKKALESQTKILRSLPYVAIDVRDDKSLHENKLVSLINVDQRTLNDMIKEKNVESLKQLGGVIQVATILETDVKDGTREADAACRKDVFGANRFNKPPSKSFLSFVLKACKDTTIIILLVCAIMSLVFGIKQHGLKNGWYDGGSIIVAVVLVIAVPAISNFRQSRQFEKLSDESRDINVQVVRDGRHNHISIFDVVVGDVVSLNIGDQIPADGLFLHGYSMKVDESSMTGESDHVEVNGSENPFLLSGTKVTDGVGFMLVTSVGMSTAWGEMMSSISRDLDEQTPLQARLNKLTSYIGKVGLTVAIVVLVVMMIRYFTGNTRDNNGQKEYFGSKTKVSDVLDSVVGIIAAAVTTVEVAIPEGLPLAVTITLAYSMKRMMKDNARVRKLSACETMGSATTICTDKTGTLTLNQMKVTEFCLGKETIESNTEIESEIYHLLQEGVALNTTATVNNSHANVVPEITGSPTEKAIISWAVMDLGMNINETKGKCEIIHVETFNSEKKRSGVLMRKNSEKAIHTHWKGAAEMILAMCSNYYVRNGEVRDLNDEEKLQFGAIIQSMAAKSLRCIAFAHKKVVEENSQVSAKLEQNGMTFLGLVGLKDPCRMGVKTAVESCKNAGVNVKMITGDNMHTARAIAIECGILNPEQDMKNGAVVEGVQFRNYSPEERMAKIDNIQVMARSSPFDKLLMVQCLKEKGHVVAVTGDGTNDAPALKEADIGLSMGIQGTVVAKESSDIVILDDNFTSVVTVLRWGRCVYDNIQKFIQFQLTVNVAALVINLVAAVSSCKIPLTAVQLLWVNLIMHTLGALALATEQPTNDLMTRPPVGRSEPLVTKIMWRNLLAQALYQVTILLTLQFKGKAIFGVDEEVKNTLIFNTFVLCQVFNEFNARKLEKINIFKGIYKNKLFLAIRGITIILQVLMVELLNKFASTERLNWQQWGACIAIAVLTWPIGCLVKCIPVSCKRTQSH